MGAGSSNGRIWLFGSVLALALPAFAPSGHARTQKHETPTHKIVQAALHARDAHHTVSRVTHASVHLAAARGYAGRTRVHYSGISCVPYARNATGITVAGNAWQWWDNAAGTYQRGEVPEPGGVLAFRANGRMRLGHVAVVTKVVNDREIEIEHANWAGGGVAHGVAVVDVSENNDWTAVRVSLGSRSSFGSIYPTYGFIYDRPDGGTMLTAITAPAAQPALNAAPRDLRPLPERSLISVAQAKTREYDEVAEAPTHPRHGHGGTRPVNRHDRSLAIDRAAPAALSLR
jgi:surface antigen